MKARLEEVAHMEKLSRVKKYEELRKSIEMDNNINALNNSTELQNSENLLKSFDSSIIHKDSPTNDAKKAKREKSEVADENENDLPTTDTFTNEYLDDFMKEVRDYNIRKGNREKENTEVDILYQLNAANRLKRAQYVSEITEDHDDQTNQKDVIANEVKNLLSEDNVEDTSDDLDVSTDESTQKQNANEDTVELISSFMKHSGKNDNQSEDAEEEPHTSDTLEVRVPNDVKKVKQERKPIDVKKCIEGIKVNSSKKLKELKKTNQEQFYEETQKIKVQLDECENEITDLSHDVTKNNKLLNYLLILLTFILFVIIGFFIYKIFKVGGY